MSDSPRKQMSQVISLGEGPSVGDLGGSEQGCQCGRVEARRRARLVAEAGPRQEAGSLT